MGFKEGDTVTDGDTTITVRSIFEAKNQNTEHPMYGTVRTQLVGPADDGGCGLVYADEAELVDRPQKQRVLLSADVEQADRLLRDLEIRLIHMVETMRADEDVSYVEIESSKCYIEGAMQAITRIITDAELWLGGHRPKE